MSQTVPTTLCAAQFESQVNGAIDAGNTDIFHFISDGTVVSWIDWAGYPGGNLNQGGGGGGGTTVLVNGSPVPSPADLINGSGVALAVTGSNVAFNNTGVTTVNGQTGNVTIDVEGADIPWLDIRNYGGLPKASSSITETTTVVTHAGSPNVTLSSPLHFVNGEGISIPQGGAATLLQIAPAAPTVTSPSVQGSQTLNYKIVAFDNNGGISPASTAAQVTNAPAIFGTLPQTITSINQSGNVVTVNFAGPLNNTVAPGMTIHIVGFTSTSAIFNGVWTIASSSSANQVTFALNGSLGAGSVTGVQTGRVSNVQLITAISRASTGVLTITTAQSNNAVTNATSHATIVIVENCFPASLNGQYIPTSISGTSIVCQTGNYIPETGTVVANGDTTQGTATSASTATFYEYVQIVCPTLPATDAIQSPPLATPTTCGYYIYSDSPNPGGALVLIGKTVSGNTPTTGNYHFVDWGPCQAAGYVAPAYIPTTAPTASQNKFFSAFIVSGEGTDALVLSANVTSSVTSYIQHDDAPALAAAVAATGNQIANAVLFSPPIVPITNPQYIINSPIAIPNSCNLVFGCSIYCNETISYGTSIQVSVVAGAVVTVDPAFGQRNYVLVTGLANPMFGGNYSFTLDGLGFETLSNGQIGLLVSGPYSQISNSAFFVQTNTQGTSTPLVYQNSTSALLFNINASAYSRFGDVSVVGQSCFGPPIPSIWFRTTDNPNLNLVPPAQVTFAGNHTLSGRGVLFDSFGANVGEGIFYQIGAQFWNQATTNPTFMFWGAGFSDINISCVVNDTSECAVLANWTTQSLMNVVLHSGIVSNVYPIVTGNPITGLQVNGASGLNQNQNVFQILTGTSNAGTGTGGLVNTGLSTSKTLNSQPLDLGSAGVIFGKVKVTGVTASASGSGSFANETWTVQVSCVGWDGGESELSDIFTISPNPNGSQGIAASWNAVPGIKGYLVYLRGFRQSNTPLTTNSVFYSGFANAGAVPTMGVSGLPILSLTNGGTLVAPNIVVTPSSGYNEATINAGTLTANRTASLPDASGTLLVGSAIGVGTGSNAGMTVNNQGAGGGPTNPLNIIGWTQINLGGTLYWIGLAQ